MMRGPISTGNNKRGILQSRGLGDILIALPIAKEYENRGEEIHWPIDEQFYSSVVNSVPWVKWYPMKADEAGRYFVETPLQIFKYNEVSEVDALYLYHFLSSQPQMTNPELFNILKFDQYKYQVTGVPFARKWSLGDCVVRDLGRENLFKEKVLGSYTGEYAVVHLDGSTFKAQVDLSWIDPAVKVIEINASTMSDNVFDWLTLLQGAKHIVCIDSVIANMIEGMLLDKEDGSSLDLYWIRRSPWDLTPVLGLSWQVISTSLPIVEAKRIDPAVMAAELYAKIEAAQRARTQDPAVTKRTQQVIDDHPANRAYLEKKAAGSNTAPIKKESNLQSHVPFQAKGNIPKSFLDKVKPLTPEQAAMLNGGSGNKPAPPQSAPKHQPVYEQLKM